MSEQREFKFRVWDKNRKKMKYSQICSYISWCGSSMVFDSERFGSLMQYTGLLDKNGKEIYEGDIIKLVGKFFVIEYLTTVASYIAHERGVDITKQIEKYQGYFQLALWNKNAEVVGNIHENPEMLEQ